jgi:hypothetical protein
MPKDFDERNRALHRSVIGLGKPTVKCYHKQARWIKFDGKEETRVIIPATGCEKEKRSVAL